MWNSSCLTISMAEGDYGIDLPITITGAQLSAGDEVRLKITRGTTEILSKVFNEFTNNTVSLCLTEEESAQLPIGIYTYSLDWYQDGFFMCNLIPFSIFKVVDKA